MKPMIMCLMFLFFSASGCAWLKSDEIQTSRKKLTLEEESRLAELEQKHAEGELTETEYQMHADDLKRDEDIKF